MKLPFNPIASDITSEGKELIKALMHIGDGLMAIAAALNPDALTDSPPQEDTTYLDGTIIG